MKITLSKFGEFLLSSKGVRIGGALLLVFGVTAVVARHYLPPPLPEVVRLGTGPDGGYYSRFGDALRKEVAEHGVELELVTTAGSVDNIRQLLDGEIDVGLVQGGNLSDAQAQQLVSIASVFYEPLLLVTRADWEADHVEGGRIAIGEAGSGVHELARELLEAQGVRDGVPPATRFVEIGGQRAVEALLAGEVDSAIFVTPIDVIWARTLFTEPSLRVTNFALAEAFTRHYRYLTRIVIPAGLIDLHDEIPPQDVQVIATTASLVARRDINSAVIPLLIESAREQLYQGDLLADPGEFPSGRGVEAPLAGEAQQYFERGPSFFYRWLPFRYASAATRLTIILIPLLTLLYPLFRSAGPAYRWVNERRIYRWYGVLQKIERRMDASHDVANLQQLRTELERIGKRIRATHVPARYGENLFALQVHLQLLVNRLESLEKNARAFQR